MKRPALLAAMIACSVTVIGLSHAHRWPLYEWTRILIMVPIIYAGVNFRRAGSFTVLLLVMILQSPLILMEHQHSPANSVTFFFAMFAACVIAFQLGHMIRRNRSNAEDIDRLGEVFGELQDKTDADSVFRAFLDYLRRFGGGDKAGLYLLDADGRLRRFDAPEEPPLPESHLFQKVADTNEYMVSNSLADDPRIRFLGGEVVAQLSVFPLFYGGRVRGAAFLADSTDEHFGGETVSFLITIKQSVENALELLERRQTTIQHELERTRIRDAFSSYVSRTVAEEILKDPDRLELGGSLRDVTVMFVEAANFPELLKSVRPLDLIYMLNEYFTLAIDTVFEYDGTLDKFMGAGLMAFWGAPLPGADGESRAVRCALDLQRKISELNQSWEFLGRSGFQLCIGINSGPVVAGNIGSIRRMEYTVIGDAVNTAARIGKLASTGEAPVLISESAYERVSAEFEFLDGFEARVKGKSESIRVYGVLGRARDGRPPVG